MPIIKERRRFTDVMEEEATVKREDRLSAWGRDDFSVYKMHKTGESVEIQVILKYFYLKKTLNTVEPRLRDSRSKRKIDLRENLV